MTEMEKKISEVLSNQEFYENNKDLEKHEDIIAAVQEKVPEATAEEIDAYMTMISTVLQKENEDLSEEDLDNVAGGIVITTAVIGTVCTCIGTSITVGGLIGGAIWYWKNRKK